MSSTADEERAVASTGRVGSSSDEQTEDATRLAAGGTTAAAVAVAITHGMNDMYSAFLHPLLPRIMDRLGLNVALAATLAMTLSLGGSLVQPAVGHLADRYGRRAFVVIGPAMSAVFMSLIGVAPSFIVLVVFLALAGLGSAAFHPPGSVIAASSGSSSTRGARYSFFSFSGSLGYAVGPLVAVAIVSRGGLERLPYAAIPMLLLLPIVFAVMPSGAHQRRQARHEEPAVSLREALRGPLALVFGISAVSAFMQRVYLTMKPILVAETGGSEQAGATALSIYLGAQALGSLAGGMLADRMDRRHLLLWLSALSMPAHALAFLLPAGSAGALLSTMTAGFLNMALLPPLVLIAQELVPRGESLGAGIAMGAAWAAGSIAVLGIGVLADLIGVLAAALVAVPLTSLGVVLAWALPADGRLEERATRKGGG
ncbi:MAG: MFS transporter [Candidatus Cloacimonetes bacterium]|nr:MFS transporter [Candidatus Cloacimonadota bacterium]